MRKTLLALAGVLTGTAVMAQAPVQNKCATMPSLEYRKTHDPLWGQHQSSQRNAASGYDTTGYIVIPVVFHVVYNTNDSVAQNIPDSIIWSQMQVLNEDFARMNADAVNTLSVFDSIAVNTGVHFQLATIDPLGNPTNGITRTPTTTSHLLTPLNNSVKANSSGGKDPWPTNQYLNFWVCDMSFMGQPIVLGYAQFPGDNPATDGVVFQYNYVGKTLDPGTAPNNLGRTATHETGHWLGQRHVWGDGACGVDDGIMDTPDADDASQTNCALSANTCTDAGNTFWGGYDPVDNVQNYMDYSEDGCMNMFSRGQMHSMWYHVVENRTDLFTSNGAGVPPLNAYAISKRISCAGNCDGWATVTPVAGTAPFTYLWNDGLAQDSSTAINLCKGMYTVRVIDADNDTIWVNAWVHGPDFIMPTFSSTSAPCGTCATGTITVNAAGGVMPYMYSINSGTPQTSNQFTGLTPGNYLVTVTDSCGNSSSDSVSVQNTNGIDEEMLAGQIHVMPNPAQSNITVECTASGVQISKVEIMNMLGQQVTTVAPAGSVNTLRLDVSAFENGMYLLRIKAGEHNYITKILVEK